MRDRYTSKNGNFLDTGNEGFYLVDVIVSDLCRKEKTSRRTGSYLTNYHFTLPSFLCLSNWKIVSSFIFLPFSVFSQIENMENDLINLCYKNDKFKSFFVLRYFGDERKTNGKRFFFELP